MKIRCLSIAVLFLTVTSIGFAQSKTVDPRNIVKNLYAAQKAGSGPFLQTKNRPVVDKYFTQKLADLIWKDAATANGKTGLIDFDPLYGSQVPQIKDFNIMETGWGGDESKFGSDDEAVVQVTFKASGKERMVSFEFKLGKDKSWKIYDIRYSNDGLQDRLVELLDGTASVGGFRVSSKTAPDTIEAANFAIAKQSKTANDDSLKLISVERVETQNVAGTNYRLCLIVSSNKVSQPVTAMVHKNYSDDKFSLTDWKAEKCGSKTK